MSLFVKDSLLSLRKLNQRKSDQDSSGAKHLLPMQDLQEQVLAKRRRLVQQRYLDQPDQPEENSKSLRSDNPSSKKSVSFDLERNVVHYRHLGDDDLQNAWMSVEDFSDIQTSIRETVASYRRSLLNRDSKKETEKTSQDESVCMRGLEHQASESLTRSKIFRIKNFHSLLLSRQHLLQLQFGKVDADHLAEFSRQMTVNDAWEAVTTARLDSAKNFQPPKLLSPGETPTPNLNSLITNLKSSLQSPVLPTNTAQDLLRHNLSLRQRQLPTMTAAESAARVEKILSSSALRNILSQPPVSST